MSVATAGFVSGFVSVGALGGFLVAKLLGY